MLVDQPFFDQSEDRSAAPNIEQGLKSQNSNEFNLPQLKTTAGMKRMNDSTTEDDVDKFIVIRKRAKEGKVLNPDFS